MVTAFLILGATQYPRLPEVRTAERNVKIYVGRQNIISFSKSINLLSLYLFRIDVYYYSFVTRNGKITGKTGHPAAHRVET